jgi:aspartate/methionine/tyrosine aminotransferase
MRTKPGREPNLVQTARAKALLAPSARSDVPPFMVMDVMEHAARIEAAGGRVIHMEVGQPAANAPATAIAAAKAALDTGRIGYTTALGIPSLRNRIAGYYREQHKLEVDPSRIVVTTGSSGGFILAFLSLFEPGDRVAMASPGYPPYRNILRALGCVPVEIEISERDRWAITKEALLAEHAKAPLAGVIVASPANPTGTMIPPEQLKELIGACTSAGIRFISDEIYHGLEYAFEGETAAKFSDEVFVINSFSKYFCMTGWRVGWMVVPEAFIRSVERLQQNLAISVPTLSQIAAEAAFDGREEMDAIKRGYEENRRILIEGLPKAGLDSFLPADGAFYLYANVAKFTNDSLDFAKKMLDEAGVAATSGIDFDTARGSHYLRFCYAGSAQEMHEAVEKIGNWLKRG